jgi:hypothetical protein
MTYNAAWLDLIDQRVRAGQDTTRAMGTVVTYETVAPRCTVTFDGSAQAIPVKMFPDINAIAGDRVGLVKFGTEWVVVGSFTNRPLTVAGLGVAPTPGNTASATYADMPGPPTFPFFKRWDTTRVKLDVAVIGYGDSLGLIAEFGVQFGALTTIPVFTYPLASTTGGASPLYIVTMAGTSYVPAVTVPAGQYTAVLRWRRTVTGTLFVTADGWISVTATEIGA